MEIKSPELGFVDDNFDPVKLESCFFPSKVGGKPSWLFLTNLPSDGLLCSNCNKRCVFLMQIYCPIDTKSSCFHRSIFVFVCKDPNCFKSERSICVKAFRSQLPRRNRYYSFEPVDELNLPSKLPHASDYQTLCDLCGCIGKSLCSRCKSVHYCSKEHQVFAWKHGHKLVCGKTEVDKTASKGILLYALLIREY